jgi:hypothetical protein
LRAGKSTSASAAKADLAELMSAFSPPTTAYATKPDIAEIEVDVCL